eukprot:2592881-Amphidinium_carterae.2
MTRRATMLGFDLRTEPVHEATDPQRRRADVDLACLPRVTKLPGGATHKAKILALMVSNLWRWAPLGQNPHSTTGDNLRGRVTATLNVTAMLNGPKLARAQAPEILYGVVLKEHTLELVWLSSTHWHSTIILAWKMIRQHDDAKAHLRVCCTRHSASRLRHDAAICWYVASFIMLVQCYEYSPDINDYIT